MLHIPSQTAAWTAYPPKSRASRLIALLLLVAGLSVSGLTAFAATAASAASTCDPGSDTCVVSQDAVQTPLGPVTIAVSAANVVTVQLAPADTDTLVLGIPFAIPPGPPSLPGHARTTIATGGGVVDIDTFAMPRGSQSRFALPNLMIVSIHPTGPCRVSTNGTTVVFTPVIPPGPPS